MSKGSFSKLEDEPDGYGGFDELDTMKRDGLKPFNFFAYMLGHVYNDLCATAWFTYLLYFLKEVMKLDTVAG